MGLAVFLCEFLYNAGVKQQLVSATRHSTIFPMCSKQKASAL